MHSQNPVEPCVRRASSLAPDPAIRPLVAQTQFTIRPATEPEIRWRRVLGCLLFPGIPPWEFICFGQGN